MQYAIHIFSGDGHIGEKFESLEDSAQFLLAHSKTLASLPEDQSLYIIIRPSFKKDIE